MSKNPPKITIALGYLQKKIADAVWTPGMRLPTSMQLANHAGVSINIMSKAIKVLKEKGVLSAFRKEGIFLGAPEKRPKTSVEIFKQVNKAHYLADKITRDIIDGKFGNTGLLPSLKELGFHYAASYRTIKRSLAVLEDNQRITQYKRQIHIRREQGTTPFSSLHLIQGIDYFHHITQSYYKKWSNVFIHHLEKECSQRTLGLKRNLYPFIADKPDDFSLATGFIIWLDRTLAPKINELVQQLSMYGKPIVIFDSMEQNIAAVHAHRHVHLLCTSNYHAGYSIGKLLLDLGHRKVCYLARQHEPHYDGRLEGVKSAFVKLGQGTAELVPLYHSDIGNLELHDIIKKDKKDKRMDVLRKQYKDVIAARTLVESMKLPVQTYTNMWATISDEEYHLSMRFKYNALFYKACSITHCTAWILADDYLAVFGALEFLRRERVRIPQDLSVASFLNMVEALDNDLTSYDYNFSAIACRIVDRIMYPLHRKKGLDTAAIEETEGFIAVRGSTRSI